MDADLTVLPPRWNALFQDSGRRLGTKLPQLRESADVRSPVIVGVMHPVLLLPEDFANHSQNEVQAAMFHELAHVRRHDYLGNLLCQLAALPMAWHPLTYGVLQRIRRTREMICDDIAARAMQSEIGYAKCLLAMAGRTLRQHDFADAAQAIGLFGDNVLEERIMRLMQEKTTMTMQARLARIASGAIAMMLAIAMAVSFHVTPTLAQTSGTAVTVPPPPAPPTPPAPISGGSAPTRASAQWYVCCARATATAGATCVRHRGGSRCSACPGCLSGSGCAPGSRRARCVSGSGCAPGSRRARCVGGPAAPCSHRA